jgi:hypothetical protein
MTANALNNSINIVDLPIEYLLQQCSLLANGGGVTGGAAMNLSNINESLLAELSQCSGNEANYYHTATPTLPNSCSQIFATAASFNISQNVRKFFFIHIIFAKIKIKHILKHILKLFS